MGATICKTSKVCPRCKVEKPAGDFAPDRSKASGLSSRCHECDAAYCRERWRRNHPEGRGLRARELLAAGLQRCPGCDEAKPLDAFGPATGRPSGRTARCRECDKEYYQMIRARALRVYGRYCAVCGSREDLQFDHIDWNGAEHRKHESSSSLMRRIARTGKPIAEYRLRLLCVDCHHARGTAFADVLRCGPFDLDKIEARLRELRHAAIYQYA